MKIKDLWNLPALHKAEVNILHKRIDALESIIKERTTVSADVHYDGRNHIIVVGKYKGVDYIQCYSVPSEYFEHIILQIKNETRYANVQEIDAIPGFKAAVWREL